MKEAKIAKQNRKEKRDRQRTHANNKHTNSERKTGKTDF